MRRFEVDAAAAAATVTRMSTPVAPVPAATLLLVRDGARGLEVLMAARHEDSGFAAGALVFPGGKVDRGDLAIARRHPTLADLPDIVVASRVAAVRETWEECGILLARRAGAASVLSLAELRQASGAGSRPFESLLADTGLELAVDRLASFAHWTTPIDRPKRFDTQFFITPFEGDQEALHDGREAIDARWVRPLDLIADADAGKLKLVFATRMNLLRLGASGSVADALEATRRAKIVSITPQLVKTAAGPALRIPDDAGYPISELPLDKVARA
jgi:8-oxo-dGTP pyrophosphatase MutT (NUDIX family)